MKNFLLLDFNKLPIIGIKAIMNKLTQAQQRIFDKIPEGKWHSEGDLCFNIQERNMETQLDRMREKGFLQCKMEMPSIFYKKVCKQ